MKEAWLNEIADQTITVETNPDGFDYVSNKVSYKATWNEVASVYQTKHLLMLCDSDAGSSDTYVLIIPKHAFASKQQLNEFLDLAYQKTVADRQAAQAAASA